MEKKIDITAISDAVVEKKVTLVAPKGSKLENNTVNDLPIDIVHVVEYRDNYYLMAALYDSKTSKKVPFKNSIQDLYKIEGGKWLENGGLKLKLGNVEDEETYSNVRAIFVRDISTEITESFSK